MIDLDKAIEILDLNIKEAGSKMPPDTLDTLKLFSAIGKWLRDTKPIGLTETIEQLRKTYSGKS